MTRLLQRTVLVLLAAAGFGLLPGCMGVSSNPSYFPHLCPFWDIERTHAKPSGSSYFSDFDPHACRIECIPLDATNPVHTQHLLIATVFDEKGQPRRGRRVEWILEGVGDIIEVDESGLMPGRGYKVDNKYAVSYTDYFEHKICRHNGNPNDDFVIQPGQSWCVISSAVEGDSHMIVYAPEIANWDKHKVFVTKHWVDAEWVFPTAAVNRFGTQHVFTTKVYRHSDHEPLANYRVRYKIVDGPPAVFLPRNSQEEVAVTNLDGAANVTIAQVAPLQGVNHISIEVIRPPDPTSPGGVGMVIARGTTTKTWQAPNVTLTKTAPPTVAVGQNINYDLTVTNHGEVESKSLTVRDFIPDNVDYVSSDPPAAKEGNQLVWTLGELPAGQPRTLHVVFKSQRVGTVTNKAAVTTDEGQTDEKSVNTEVTSPQLKLSMTGPPTATLNVPVTYQLTVTNPGTGPATNVVLEDDFDAGLEHDSKVAKVELPVGTLAPGETKMLTPLTLTPRKTGKLVNRATARADGNLSDRAEHPVVVQEAKLTVKITGPANRYVGRPAVWDITVTNPGEVALANVVVHDPLPAELTFVSATEGGKLDNGQVAWNVGALKPKESKTVQVTSKCATMTQRAVNPATANADPGLEARDEAPIQIAGLPAFRLEVVDLDDPVVVGGKTTYKIDVTNQGSLAGSDVSIVALVPPEMKLLNANGPSAHTVEGQKVTFAPVSSLAPGQALNYTVEVEALKPASPATFEAELRAATLSGPVKEQEPTTIYAPGAVRRTATPTGSPPPATSEPPKAVVPASFTGSTTSASTSTTNTPAATPTGSPAVLATTPAPSSTSR
jgi:uncharacterized repeat protein (TIGR01451 family)